MAKKSAPASGTTPEKTLEPTSKPAKKGKKALKKGKKRLPPPLTGGVSRRRTERIQQIHTLIQSGGLMSAGKIAEKMGVSWVTVIRDLECMRDGMGLPLEYDERQYGWRYTATVKDFPVLALTEAEITALYVASRALMALDGGGFTPTLESALTKLSRAVPDRPAFDFKSLEHAIDFRRMGFETKVDFDAFMAMTSAIQQNREVRFDYQALHTKSADGRQVRPFQILNADGVWYLRANDPLRGGEERRFALGRMQKVQRTHTVFEPAKLAPAQNVDDAVGIFGGRPERVEFRTRGVAERVCKERQFHRTQKNGPTQNGWTEVEMNVAVTPELERLLLGWGEEALVSSPEKLRARVAERVKELYDLYVEAGAIVPEPRAAP